MLRVEDQKKEKEGEISRRGVGGCLARNMFLDCQASKQAQRTKSSTIANLVQHGY